MENNKIYSIKEEIRVLKEDYENLKNLLHSEENEQRKAELETEMNRIENLISELTAQLNDKSMEIDM